MLMRCTSRPHGTRVRIRTGICRLGGDRSVRLNYASKTVVMVGDEGLEPSMSRS
jgi:hypothetical protein